MAVLTGLSPGPAGGVEEIIVTATRRAEPLDRFPVSTARLGGAEISFVRADHPAELLNRLPGVNIQRGNGQEHLTAIRSPVLTGGAGAGSFLYLENNVPLRAAGFANVNGLFEAHGEIAGAIEVVRGPGSALYGSNAVHGMINVLTRLPGETGVSLDLSADHRGRVKGNAVVTRVGESTGTLAGLTLVHEGGNRDDAGLDSQKLTLRHDLERSRARLSTVFSAVNLNQETAGFIQGPDAYRNRGLTLTNPNPEAYRDSASLRLSTRIDINLDRDSTLSLTPYARRTDMTFLQHFLPSRAVESTGHWSVGFLGAAYLNPAPDWRLIVGLDGEFTHGFLHEFQTLPTVFGTFTQGLHYDYEVDALVAAPFARAEWQVTPAVRLTAGLRAEWTDYTYDNRTDTGVVGRFRRPADRRDSFVTLTPKLGANWRVAKPLTLYGRLARGARAPQTTDLYRLQIRQVPGDAEAETIDSAELGVRIILPRARLEAALFAMEKDNFFFRDADGFNVSDGRTRHLGAELLGRVQLTPAFSLSGSFTYARHTYRFSNQVAASTEVIESGDAVDTAPRTLGSLRLAWQPIAGLTGEAEWVHMGAYYMDAANVNRYPGHDLFNLRVLYAAGETVEVFAAVRNVLNEDYAERADFAFGSERYFPGEGITASLGLRSRF